MRYSAKVPKAVHRELPPACSTVQVGKSRLHTVPKVSSQGAKLFPVHVEALQRPQPRVSSPTEQQVESPSSETTRGHDAGHSRAWTEVRVVRTIARMMKLKIMVGNWKSCVVNFVHLGSVDARA